MKNKEIQLVNFEIPLNTPLIMNHRKGKIGYRLIKFQCKYCHCQACERVKLEVKKYYL